MRGADETGRHDQEIIGAFKRLAFRETLGHLPVTPPAVSTRHGTLIDREGK